MLYIGIDLGTSAVKLLLMDEKGSILHQVSREYPVEYPHPGWSQQNPEDWWLRVQEGITTLLKDQEAHKVKGIGVAGQMHGLVALDSSGQVIRPAILWNDSRTQPQTDSLNQSPGKEALSRPDRQHCLRRIYRPQAALDASGGAQSVCSDCKNSPAQGLHQLPPHRRPFHRLLRRFRHFAAGRGTWLLEPGNAEPLRDHQGSASPSAQEL